MKTLNEIIYGLVARVFNKHKINTDTVTIDDFDLDRVYINNDEYTLRMWNIFEDGNVSYTLFKTVGNHGKPLGSGKARTSKKLVRLLQEDAERKYREYLKNQKDE